MIRGVFLPSSICNSFSMLLIHSAFFFYYDLSVPIFCTKIFMPLSRPVIGMSSFILFLLADRMFFRCFQMSYFVCIIWFCLGIFLVFPLWLIPSNLSLRVVSFVLIVLLFSSSEHLFMFFFYLSLFVSCRRFFICISNLISHRGFDFLFVFFRGTPIFFTDYFSSCIDYIV